MDFIRSKTDRASKVAMNQIEGRLSDLIKNNVNPYWRFSLK